MSNEDTHATTVFPDIIVHCRNSSTNLVVIEIKKYGGVLRAEKFDKEKKIPAYLKEMGYRYGVFLVLGVCADAGMTSEFSIQERIANEITLTQYESPVP